MKTFLFLLALSLSCEGYALFDEMSVEEQKTTGIVKLSQDEKSSLIAWLEKARLNKARQKKLVGEFEIIAINAQNHLFMINDEQSYEATKRFRNKMATWKAGDKVRVYQTRKPIWFQFENV